MVQTRTNKMSTFKRLALVGATVLGMATSVGATPTLRGRAESTNGQKDDQKYTLGICGDDPSFQAYNHAGDSGYFTSLGAQSHGLTLIGNTGDRAGFGATYGKEFENYKISATAEKRTSPGEDVERFGAGLDYTLGSTTLGAGLDEVDGKRQSLVKIISTQENDQFGAGYRNLEDLNSASTFWCHFGPKENVGHRTWAKYDWNNKNSDSCVVFNSIIAQNPTFGTASSPWIVGRESGDMYDPSINENPLAPERVPLTKRSKGGLVGEAKYVEASKDGTETRTLRADAGFTAKVGGATAGTVIFHTADLDNSRNNSAGVSAIVDVKGFTVEATATENLDSHKVDTYISAGYSCPFSFGKK
jgi:hypothetical protein